MDDPGARSADEVVEALAASRTAAQVFDAAGRLLWVSGQLLELTGAGDDTELGYGMHLVERLAADAAAALALRPTALTYRRPAELAEPGHKAVRDAGTLAVADLTGLTSRAAPASPR